MSGERKRVRMAGWEMGVVVVWLTWIVGSWIAAVMGIWLTGPLVLTLGTALGATAIFLITRWAIRWGGTRGLLARYLIYGLVSLFACFYLLGMVGAMMLKTPWEVGAGRAVIGFFVNVWVFGLMLALVKKLLSYGGGVMGVARAMLLEAIELKVVLGFAVILLIGIPLLAFVPIDEGRLAYRIQTFLSWSLTLTGLVTTTMTVILACMSLCGEVRDKQIHSIAVKPIHRSAFLAGKWLGIMSLNTILLTMAGVSIFVYTVGYLAQLTPYDFQDGKVIENEVLVARTSVKPVPEVPLEKYAKDELDKVMQEDRQRVLDRGYGEAEHQGYGAVGEDKAIELGREALFKQFLRETETTWYLIRPGESRRYVFEGLGGVRNKDEWFQFRYQLKVSGDRPGNQILMGLQVGERLASHEFAINTAQQLALDPNWIDEEGKLVMTLVNPVENRGNTVTFRADEGLQVLYRVGGFGDNLFRTVASSWFKLSFLAALGLATATFLSFPVALLFSLMILMLSAASEFLVSAMSSYGRIQALGGPTFIDEVIRTFGMVVGWIFSGYAAYSPAESLVEGRAFTWGALGILTLTVGVLWTGIAMGVGILVFRKRELASVQV